MEINKELGIKVAENTDEKFWTDTREKCVEAIAAEYRNLKINEKMMVLCDEELKLFGKPNNKKI